MANWTDFIRDPRKASKQLHTSKRDVQRGEMMDNIRASEALRRSMRPETPAPHSPVLSPQELAALRLYEQRRRAEPPRAEGALNIIRQQLPQFFKDNQALADATGDLSLKEGALGLTGLVGGVAAPIAFGSGLTGGVTGASMSVAGDALMDEAARKILGESIQDPLSSGVFGALAGGTGKVLKPLVAALGASSSDAQAAPYAKWLSRLAGNTGKTEPLPLYINPTSAEIGSMWKSSRPYGRDLAAIRLARDRTVPDAVFAWDGSDTLHKEFADALGRSLDDFTTSTVLPEHDIERELQFLRSLPVRKAGGGAIKRIGKAAMSAFDDLRPSTVAPQGALSVVKNKGGNWLAGSIEDALRGLKRSDPRMDALLDNPEYAQFVDQEMRKATHQREAALNSWIEGPLTKYIKTRMASPDDEVRKLAEQGVLHFEPRGIRDRAPIMDQVVARRLMSGNPATERAVTPLGKQWERYADSAIIPQEVQELGAGAVGKNPWLAKLRPTDTVYNTDKWYIGINSGESLGFNHLIDELSNALNPNSGLPPHLQLTPEAVKQMSMEKAVRRVADINAHRAAQQAAANAELANKASIVREYTDPALPNPKGLRWVELKHDPEAALPEGWTAHKDEKSGRTLYMDPAGNKTGEPPMLSDQLKYEGDTMGHCVGGYCDDVLSGRSRIFSLRDAKGEPHVTVEVGNKGSYDGDGFHDFAEANGFDLDVEGAGELAMKAYNKTLEKSQPRIIQIKGKQNRKPNDEYLPFVQDFVRNNPLGGSWGDVGDLHNTGLRRVEDAFNKNEIAKLRAANIPVPEGYANAADIEELHRQFNLLTTGTEFNPARAWQRMQYDSHIDDLDINLPDRAAPMARGGHVARQLPLRDNFQGIIAAIEQELLNAA